MIEPTQRLVIRQFGIEEYVPIWHRMQTFTDERNETTLDELWCLQHPPVFTQGQAGKPEHILMPGDIPVVKVDRGGQVTYHGPGQLVVYFLLDIARKGMGARALVSAIEQSLVKLLAKYHIEAYPRPDAPGVYVNDAKIASLGLRIRKGRSFHGLSLNIDMDLSPFNRINPCGYSGLSMTQMKDLTQIRSVKQVASDLMPILMSELGFKEAQCYQGFDSARFDRIELTPELSTKSEKL